MMLSIHHELLAAVKVPVWQTYCAILARLLLIQIFVHISYSDSMAHRMVLQVDTSDRCQDIERCSRPFLRPA